MTLLPQRDEVKNRIREIADIVQIIGESVELKRAGSRYTGLCPFHAEKTPSFSVNPQGQFFHCFGCGESGDVFSFVMKYHRLSFPEALKELAKRYQIDLPEGYSWDWGSWGRRHDEGLQTMVLGLTMSLAAVVLLMAALFESFAQPLAILITLPLAFFGGFWLLWLLGYELDTVAFMGIIILIGIVVNNGIVLVDHVNSLRLSGVERRQALIEGCGDRLRPVVMTAITTIFGLIPLVLAKATVAGAYIDSIAVVVIGGLATSTVFTLLALPVWYTTLEDVGSAVLRAMPFRRHTTGITEAAPIDHPS